MNRYVIPHSQSIHDGWPMITWSRGHLSSLPPISIPPPTIVSIANPSGILTTPSFLIGILTLGLESSHRLVKIPTSTPRTRILPSPQSTPHRRKTSSSNPTWYQRCIRSWNDDGIYLLVWISCPCSSTTGYVLREIGEGEGC